MRLERRLALWLVLAACGQSTTPPAPPPGPPPPPPPPQPTRLVVKLHGSDGKPLAGRVALFDAGNVALHFGSLDLYGNRQSQSACELAPGVLATWDGLVLAYGSGDVPVRAGACAIPPGKYRVWAWRGIEYERWEGTVDLTEGRGDVLIDAALVRAWTPHGTMAADLHVHAHASDDSGVPNPQRVVAQVAAGVQVIGLSDHNVNGDLEDEIRDLKLDDTVVSIASNELTSDAVHMGVYPVPVTREHDRETRDPPRDLDAADIDTMFRLAHSFPGHPIIQINHPRFRVSSLFDETAWDGVSWPPPFPLTFDAVEVLAGYTAANSPGDRRIDDSVRDYYTLVDHGHLIAPMGNSDVHNLNWVHDGLTRNYVFVDDARTRPFDEPGFIAAIRGRRLVATSGPWLDVEVAPHQGGATIGPGQTVVPEHGAVWVDVTVSQAKFVVVDKLRVMVGGQPPVVIDVPPGRTFHWAGRVAVGAVDTWLGVDAGGDTPLPAEQTGNYQQDKWNKPGVTPYALIGVILVDANGDHRWRRGDAKDVVLK